MLTVESHRFHIPSPANRKSLAMPLLNWLLPPFPPQQLHAWAMEVARRSQDAIAARLSPAMRRMTLSECRGYIHARAAAVLEDELDLLEKQTGCGANLAAAVRQRAMSEIVRLAIGDLLKTTRQSPLQKAA
jgi:hypothetical protein